MNEKIVIIGSNHAGISAAATLTSYYRDLQVTVFEESDNIAYIGADGLLWIAGEIDNIEQTLYSSPEKLISRGVDFHLNTRVIEVNENNKTVLSVDKNDNKSETKYDKLVIATGSSPIRTIDNSDLNSGTLNSKTEILTAKTLHEGKKLFEISRNPSLKKIAVIGGGYIGVEAACAFREARDDIKIDLYQRSDSILNTYFDKEFSALGQEELEKHNINVILNSTLDSSSKNPKESNTVFDYDLVVEAVGFRPNSSLANVERIERSNAYKVNPYGQTSDSDIYAIGDCASVYNNVLEKDVNMPLGSYATHSAIIAAHHIGDTLLGSQPKHKHNGSQGASSVKVFDTILSSVGMTYSIAKEKAKEKSGAKDKFDKNVQFVDFSNVIKPKYLTAEQGNAPITVRCVFEKSTLKLLGFQIACSQDITPIIHLLSLALQNKMTAYDLRYLDMFFLPQLNQVYNFLQRTLSLVIKNNEA